ncbi:MAG: hypothetical protein Q7U78_05890 [Gallionella sp.]|nr:hypothetical protein [Gallionella sp.]
MVSKNPVIVGAVVLGILGALWLAKQGSAAKVGANIGGAAVDLTLGLIGGVNDALGVPRTSDVIAAANNQKINPLQPVGAWIGTTLYDLTSSRANGGYW